MNRKTLFSGSLLAAASSLTLSAALAVPAYAQEQTTTFDIPAQPLSEALVDFSRQAGVNAFARSGATNGYTSAPVSGTMSPEAALNQLIGEAPVQILAQTDGSFEVAQATPEADPQTGQRADFGGLFESDGSTVTGTVRGAVTGSNLKGARVELVETGQVVATDGLGRFRMSGILPGEYTLSITYLGRDSVQERITVSAEEDFSQSFEMGFPAGSQIMSTVDVLGSRSDRAQSLNLERTAPNSTTVITSDLLGTFNGTTVSEALRRAPGVAFVPDEQTGDGSNVIVRGIQPDANQVQLNGVRLLDGTGLGRAPDLSAFLTEGIDSVTINKSLLPSQDSNGVGALVEIETKGPLDRERRSASFQLEYGQRDGDFADELLFSGTVSGTFGLNDDFGLSLSAGYRERESDRLNFGVTSFSPGEYLPEGIGSLSQIDPRTEFPLVPGVTSIFPSDVSINQGSTDTETVFLNFTAQKQISNHTELRFDATHTVDRQTTYNSSTNIDTNPQYIQLPVDALGGETRSVLVVEDAFRGDFFSQLIFGDQISGSVGRNASFRPDAETASTTYSFRGDTTVDSWSFNYGIGYTTAEVASARLTTVAIGSQQTSQSAFGISQLDRSLLSDAGLANVASDGSIVSIFSPLRPGNESFVAPLFSESGFAFVNDVDALPVTRLFDQQTSSSESEAIAINASARRDFNHSFLQYAEVGFDFQDSSFFSPGADGQRGSQAYFLASGVTASDVGLAYTDGLLTTIGVNDPLRSLDRGSVETLAGSLSQLESTDLIVFLDDRGPNTDLQRATDEETLTAYFEVGFEFDRLEVIGGLRAEEIEVGSEFFSSPGLTLANGFTDFDFTDANSEFVNDSASQISIMPRLLATYRLNDQHVFRAGYYRTVTRPRLSFLTDRQQVNLDLRNELSVDGDRPRLIIERGNPDLDPAETDNFSLDWEWYTDDVGVIKTSLFYKETKNDLDSVSSFSDIGSLPGDTTIPDYSDFYDVFNDPIEVVILQPENSEDLSTIWGLELTAERQFTFLPGAWGGLGIYANYTYTDSSQDIQFPVSPTIDPNGFVVVEDVPFTSDPQHSGTAGLTYNYGGVRSSLYYTVQDRRLSTIDQFSINRFEEAIDTLDFRLDYVRKLGPTVTNFFVRGTDLLKSSEDPTLQSSIGGEGSVPKYYTSGTYLGGRQISVGVSVNF